MILRDYTDADLDGMSKEQAQLAYSNHVDELTKETGDVMQATQRVKALMPRLHAAAFPPKAPEEPTPLPNGAPPAGFQFYLPMMSLPASTTETEFGIFWRANGSVSHPVRAKAMFAAIVGFYMSRMGGGMTQAGAEAEATAKFSKLAELAKTN